MDDGIDLDTFELFLKYYNQDLLEINERDIEICRRFSSCSFKKYSGVKIYLPNLKQMFLSSINSLGDETQKFYKNVPKVKIKRRRLESGYAEIVGNNKNQEIYLNNEHLKDCDFVAFSHEMGHIPTLIKGANYDYFEYSETLSIFFEYLAALYINKSNVESIFFSNRLEVGSLESLMFLEASEYLKYDDSISDKQLLLEMRECYKYVISLEYALNLIEIYDNNRILLNKIVDEIILGKTSFKEIENKLDLNIKSYKMLKKHI